MQSNKTFKKPAKKKKKKKKQKRKKNEDDDDEDEEKTPAGKAKKIRLFPTPQQQCTLLRWFGTVRWTYSQCIASCAIGKQPSTPARMRALHVNSDALGLPSWIKETPYDVRDEAVRDFLKAFKTQKMLVAQGKRKCFMMKFRSKRRDQSIVIHSKHWRSIGLFHPTFFGKVPIRAAEPLPLELGYDSRLIRDKCGRYFLCIPHPLDDQLAHTPENEIIALDPGVRTFMTGYATPLARFSKLAPRT